MSQLSGLLKTIEASSESSGESIRKILDVLQQNEVPEFLEDSSEGHGVSLLSLKYDSLLSYLNSLALILLSRVEDLKDSLNGDDESGAAEASEKAVENSVVQRVVLERGVKGLEKKISYQLDKMVRSYNKEKDSHKHLPTEVNIDEDSDSDADLNFKPNALALSKRDENDEERPGKTYKPPKITAIAPPSSNTGGSKPGRKLQAMEEYIEERGDAPLTEYSIGSNIVDHGRGGIKTKHDVAKEEEITRYEEDNFTRLPRTQTKKSAKDKKKEQENVFGGEDWGIFNNNREYNGGSNKRKANGAWDKAKRKRKN